MCVFFVWRVLVVCAYVGVWVCVGVVYRVVACVVICVSWWH